MNNNSTLLLTIKDRQQIKFKDTVKAVTSFNERGIFDVLPQHANFISIIKDNIIIHKTTNAKEEIKIAKGIMRVSQNEVNVYLDILTDKP